MSKVRTSNAVSFSNGKKRNKYAKIVPLLIKWGDVKRELRGLSDVNNFTAEEHNSYLLKSKFIDYDKFKIIDSYVNSLLNEHCKEFMILRYVRCYTFPIIASEMCYCVRQINNIHKSICEDLENILF